MARSLGSLHEVFGSNFIVANIRKKKKKDHKPRCICKNILYYRARGEVATILIDMFDGYLRVSFHHYLRTTHFESKSYAFPSGLELSSFDWKCLIPLHRFSCIKLHMLYHSPTNDSPCLSYRWELVSCSNPHK